MNFKKRRLAQIFSILIGVMCLSAFFLRSFWMRIAVWKYYPECVFHKATGYLCPACGNTRAVLALLQGHLIQSLGYNPMILTLSVILLCLYLELVCYAVGKPRHILPRSYLLLTITLVLLLGYELLRNFIPAITLC